MLHFREALAKTHTFRQLCWSSTQYSWSSPDGEYVFSPSLSRCLALGGHFIPKQNYSELLFQAKCVKEESKKTQMIFHSYLTSLPNFLHLTPYDCLSKISSFQFAFTLFNNMMSTETCITKNLFTCLFLHVKKRNSKNFLFICLWGSSSLVNNLNCQQSMDLGCKENSCRDEKVFIRYFSSL